MSPQSNSRIGILGGTFNPIHTGHLIVAQSAIEAFELSKVLLMPSQTPPHKTAANLLSVEHRRAMVEQAIEGDLRFELCDIELKRFGPSYSIDTVIELKALNPGADYSFIIGADSLLELHMWHRINELLELCSFVTLGRPGFDTEKLTPKDLKLDQMLAEKLLENISGGIKVDISSSEIRYRIAEGMSIKYLVPASVEMYISEHGLYRV